MAMLSKGFVYRSCLLLALAGIVAGGSIKGRATSKGRGLYYAVSLPGGGLSLCATRLGPGPSFFDRR